jgi:riboflavin kinase
MPCRAQVPPAFHLQSGPLRLAGDVTTGFGRGSAQLGFPTANLPPEPLAGALAGLPSGVYFG